MIRVIAPSLSYGEYLGTPEGDRLSTLAAAWRMSLTEKILWSEACAEMATHAQHRRGQTLRHALQQWAS